MLSRVPQSDLGHLQEQAFHIHSMDLLFTRKCGLIYLVLDFYTLPKGATTAQIVPVQTIVDA